MSKFQPGDLLIAPPAMIDPRFRNTVLLITQHGPTGTQALCLNKPIGHNLNDVIAPLGVELEENPKMFWGGPIGVNTVWMLHEQGWECENTLSVTDEWAMTSSMNMFEHIADGDRPETYRVIMGLSTWEPGQLAAELNGTGSFTIESSWLVARAPCPQDLFDRPNRDLWQYCCEIAANQAVNDWLT
jgi:putative transcriptional regulator